MPQEKQAQAHDRNESSRWMLDRKSYSSHREGPLHYSRSMHNKHLLLHVAEQASILLPVAVSTLIAWNNGIPDDALNILKKTLPKTAAAYTATTYLLKLKVYIPKSAFFQPDKWTQAPGSLKG